MDMRMPRLLPSVVAGVLLMLGVGAAQADEPFYAGKRLTLLINFAPGGPTDVEGRLLAKHIVRHIDGNPLLVVQNKDGASGMVGQGVLRECLLDGQVERVLSLGRSGTGRSDPKLREIRRDDLFDFTKTASDGLSRTDTAAREWIGLLAYWLAGRSDALFPGPEGS